MNNKKILFFILIIFVISLQNSYARVFFQTDKKSEINVYQSPESIFKAVIDAMISGDLELIYDYVSKKEQANFDKEAEKFAKQMSNPEEQKKFTPENIQSLKKVGLTKEAYINPNGRTMLRVSLGLAQMMIDYFSGDNKEDILKSFQDDAPKIKLINVKYKKDKREATLYLLDAKGKKQKQKVILEDGKWKLKSFKVGGKKNK